MAVEIKIEVERSFASLATPRISLVSHRYLNSKHKRLFDIVASIVGILLTVLFAPFAVVLVKIGSPGPLFYRQKRFGQNGRVFNIVKFRSMRVDAESDGAQWTSPDDPRIFWTGKLLRRAYLDEFPQWWNVLKGEMSVVGPRPERPEMITTIVQSVSNFGDRLAAKPGITGLAQVNYKYGSNIRDARNKLRLDTIYIENASLLLDAKIILLTFRRVFLTRGT